MKQIHSPKGNLIAILVRKNFCKKKGPHFICQEHFPLQVGVSVYDKGYKIEPHRHLPRKIIIREVQEKIYLESGKIRVYLYDEDDRKFKTTRLKAGDLILFTGQGGHGFDILEKSKLIEVKQGPYLGRDKDKKVIL